MHRSNDHWLNTTKLGRAILFAFFVAIILFVAAPIFLALRALTGWPVWLLILIALPTGALVFITWAKIHEKNGFD